MTEDGVATSYTYDAANRLLSSTTGGTVKACTYDTNGNRTQMTASGTDSYTTTPQMLRFCRKSNIKK